MFLRQRGPADGRSHAFQIALVGVVLVLVGGFLLGLGAIGVPLSGRPAFAAVLLPAAGLGCLIWALVVHIRD